MHIMTLSDVTKKAANLRTLKTTLFRSYKCHRFFTFIFQKIDLRSLQNDAILIIIYSKFQDQQLQILNEQLEKYLRGF